jgi:hypothetical protein
MISLNQKILFDLSPTANSLATICDAAVVEVGYLYLRKEVADGEEREDFTKLTIVYQSSNCGAFDFCWTWCDGTHEGILKALGLGRSTPRLGTDDDLLFLLPSFGRFTVRPRIRFSLNCPGRASLSFVLFFYVVVLFVMIRFRPTGTVSLGFIFPPFPSRNTRLINPCQTFELTPIARDAMYCLSTTLLPDMPSSIRANLHSLARCFASTGG